MGTFYIFEHAIGFLESSMTGSKTVWTANMDTITGIRLVPVMVRSLPIKHVRIRSNFIYSFRNIYQWHEPMNVILFRNRVMP